MLEITKSQMWDGSFIKKVYPRVLTLEDINEIKDLRGIIYDFIDHESLTNLYNVNTLFHKKGLPKIRDKLERKFLTTKFSCVNRCKPLQYIYALNAINHPEDVYVFYIRKKLSITEILYNMFDYIKCHKHIKQKWINWIINRFGLDFDSVMGFMNDECICYVCRYNYCVDYYETFGKLLVGYDNEYKEYFDDLKSLWKEMIEERRWDSSYDRW